MVDVELYGGKRGYLEHLGARALYALGGYRAVRQIEWDSVRRLVFVCKGNICRSPYASARAQMLGAPAASFGLNATEGTSANSAAVRNALMRNVDLTRHRAAKWDAGRVVDSDLVVVFERAQLAEVKMRGAERTPQITLLGLWVRTIRPHIQDPYGQSDRYFQQCFSIIDLAVAELVKRIARKPTSESLTDRRVPV